MKKTFSCLVIIALIAVIGFGITACSSGGAGGGGGGGGTKVNLPGTGTYKGKDIVGNSYSLQIGSSISANRARAVLPNDDVRLNLTTRDGITRHVKATVVEISNDGTLTLKEKGTNIIFSAKVDGTSTLDSIVTPLAARSLTFVEDSTEFMPRSFDTVFLRASRWVNASDPANVARGENWSSWG